MRNGSRKSFKLCYLPKNKEYSGKTKEKKERKMKEGEKREG